MVVSCLPIASSRHLPSAARHDAHNGLAAIRHGGEWYSLVCPRSIPFLGRVGSRPLRWQRHQAGESAATRTVWPTDVRRSYSGGKEGKCVRGRGSCWRVGFGRAVDERLAKVGESVGEPQASGHLRDGHPVLLLVDFDESGAKQVLRKASVQI